MTSQPEAGPPRLVLAGGSGFIGRHLHRDHLRRGYEVVTIGRSGPARPDLTWDDPAGIANAVDGSAVLVNLAGKSVGCRYTDRNRDEILRSRVHTTRLLNDAVRNASQPPSLWLNASTATIYRHAMDRPQTEDTGELGHGFSVDVARTWESEFFAHQLPATRRAALRMTIVLGDGPAVQMLRRAARFGAGGPHLDGWWFSHNRYRGIGPDPTPAARRGQHTAGEQKFSWIHIDDVVAAIRFLEDRTDLSGPVNLAAPTASTNRLLMAAVRRSVGAPVGVPAPRWLLEIGMAVLRQESELLLKSRWVVPQRLLDAGFRFSRTDLAEAIAQP